tara:strand:+ start:8454 stop:8870 length:417 start_codon:yes stop_codon:yes gene_type:complete
MESNRLIEGFMGVEISFDLQYHTSWDWLMPVIREILVSIEVDNLNYDTEELKSNTLDCDIDGAYKEVVEFIKSQKEKSLSYDDTRDISIRCIQKLIELGHLHDDYDTHFEIQDAIQDEINDKLGLDIDDRFELTITYN